MVIAVHADNQPDTMLVSSRPVANANDPWLADAR
jgi:hypothetical protein